MGRIFLSFVLLMLCSCGADLAEDEARRLIEIELDLPKLIERKYTIRQKKTKAFEGLQKLVSDGYFRRDPKPMRGGVVLIPTEKGKANFGIVEPTGLAYSYQFKGSIYKQVFGRIEEILMDPHTQKRATVTFTTEWEGIEPFFSLLCQEGCILGISWQESYFGKNIVEFLDQVTPYVATFTKYDKGWRVDYCSEMGKEAWEKKKRLLQTSKH